MSILDYFLHFKWKKSVLALKMWPFRWVKSYGPIFESNLAPLHQGQYSPITRAEVGQPWAGIAFWLSCFGLNCAQMAPGGAESDFSLQGRIGTLGLKQIFLIFSVSRCQFQTILASHELAVQRTVFVKVIFRWANFECFRGFSLKNNGLAKVNLTILISSFMS